MVILGFVCACLICAAAVVFCSMLACAPPRRGAPPRLACVAPADMYGRLMAALSPDGTVVRAALLCAAAGQLCAAVYMAAAVKVFVSSNVRGAFLTVCLPSLFVCLLELMFFAAVRVFRKRDR